MISHLALALAFTFSLAHSIPPRDDSLITDTYHEELACERVDAVIATRLANGEQPKFGYGKLMERLLYMRRSGVSAYKLLEPAADKRLRSLHLALESPVSVLGDASFSMDVAISKRPHPPPPFFCYIVYFFLSVLTALAGCATIIGSVLTLLTNADLKVRFIN
jgi:hypothetical protein